MAYFGGRFNYVGDHRGIGTAINISSAARGAALSSTRGVVAVPLELNWGADTTPRSITATDWKSNTQAVLGYSPDAPELWRLRELFTGGAQEVVVARLNGAGDKAKNELAVAQWPGTRGNDITISAEADPDAGDVTNEYAKVSVRFKQEANKITATVTNVPEGGTLAGAVTKDGANVPDVFVSVNDNVITYDFPATVDEGDYEAQAYIVKSNSKILVSTAKVGITISPETHREVNLTKGTETTGETVESATATITFDKSRITVSFASVPEGYTPSVRVKGQVGILGFIPGRLEDTSISGGMKHYIDYYPGAPSNGQMTVEACLTKDKIQVINKCTYTVVESGEDKAAAAVAKYNDTTPVTFSKTVPAKFEVKTFLDGREVDSQKVKNVTELRDNDYINWTRTSVLEEIAGEPLSGGTNSDVALSNYSNALDALETQVFHILCWPIINATAQSMAVEFTKRLRDQMGVHFQTVMAETEKRPNYHGVIQVTNKTEEDTFTEAKLTYWVAGLEGGCELNASCGNVEYDGDLSVSLDLTQRDLENCLDNGLFAFHQARGQDRLQHTRTFIDLNTLTEFEEGQDESWTRNQTIRVNDYICNELAALFNNKYACHYPNNEASRIELKTDIDLFLQGLQKDGAIENYNTGSLEIERVDATTVYVAFSYRPLNGMEQLYVEITLIP